VLISRAEGLHCLPGGGVILFPTSRQGWGGDAFKKKEKVHSARWGRVLHRPNGRTRETNPTAVADKTEDDLQNGELRSS